MPKSTALPGRPADSRAPDALRATLTPEIGPGVVARTPSRCDGTVRRINVEGIQIVTKAPLPADACTEDVMPIDWPTPPDR
ncbi:hypothetical protein Xph01_04370 [Micromonospora phaseoli]|nr:hypothetical protein Xph01_04370 [Micromonospora phaseoli]